MQKTTKQRLELKKETMKALAPAATLPYVKGGLLDPRRSDSCQDGGNPPTSK